MKIVLLVVFLVIGVTIGSRLRRLAGGHAILIEEVPYQVSLRYCNYHICGGALISPRHVLTAAHCVADLFNEPYAELTAVTGTSSLSRGGTVNRVKRVVWHDQFKDDANTTWKYDIAVITLTANVDENNRQRIIKLPTEEPRVNGIGIISGFGHTDSFDSYPSVNLQGATTRILSIEACRKFMKNCTIHDTNVCGWQKNGIGLCHGDSGGPLDYNGTVVGIFSWTFPCGLGSPDVYTNVYRYLDFIQNAMKDS